MKGPLQTIDLSNDDEGGAVGQTRRFSFQERRIFSEVPSQLRGLMG